MTPATPTEKADGGYVLPREISPGLHWVGRCSEQMSPTGENFHAYNSVFVLQGSERTLIFEAAIPGDWPVVEDQLDGLLGDDSPPVEFIVTSHAEIPHASGVGRLLEKYPTAKVYGDVTDFHLIFPEFADRLVWKGEGDELDLGDRRFVFLDAIIRDLPNSIWGFDTGGKVLFPGDGFAYMHEHAAGQCGHFAEEVPKLPIEHGAAVFAHYALYWTRFTDVEPFIQRLDELVDERGVEIIAGTHGLPITNVSKTVPLVWDGLRLGADAPEGDGAPWTPDGGLEVVE